MFFSKTTPLYFQLPRPPPPPLPPQTKSLQSRKSRGGKSNVFPYLPNAPGAHFLRKGYLDRARGVELKTNGLNGFFSHEELGLFIYVPLPFWLGS